MKLACISSSSVLGAALLAVPLAAKAVDGEWVRMRVASLRTSETPPPPLRTALRRLWADRLDADEQKWRANPGPAGGAYPARVQWALLDAGGRQVVISSLAGIFECSPAGSFSKDDLFTWCPLRVQSSGKAPIEVDPACWIESEPGAVPDPATSFMRARLEPGGVRVQVVQRGQAVPQCDKLVPLP